MFWPFKREKPDERPPTATAEAIAKSLRNDPARWRIHPRDNDYLVHDSGVMIGTNGFTWGPNLTDEPDRNAEVVGPAVHDWVARMLTLPPKAPQELQDD